MIHWEDVTVSYGPSRVLGPVTVRVATGEWVGVIGPNGAGKSSLLKAAVGLVDHTGSISIGRGVSRPGLDIAWMPQRPGLPDEMGVADYVMLGRTPHLGYLGREGSADRTAVSDSMARLGLTPLASRRLDTLSGGEAQRVLFARALAQEAPVLLLDEPTASLDMGHAIDVLEVVDELREERHLTVVTAVHDLTLAGRFADRLVLLAHGSVAADDVPDRVLTESLLSEHYGSGIRVISEPDGPAVVPTRSSNA